MREQFFASMTLGQFEKGLSEKEWAVLLVDPSTNEIQGFSTLKRIRAVLDGQRIVAYFSGETAIDPSFWGQMELPRAAGRHIMILAAAERDSPAYWFLITSSYRTYRFLPLFFEDYYPGCGSPAAGEIKRVLDHLALQEFGREYDPARGVIRFDGATPLLRKYAEIPARRLKDPDVAFFAVANSGHLLGEELACLAPLYFENLTPAGRRVLAGALGTPNEKPPGSPEGFVTRWMGSSTS
ncbi:MAG: hypothetical protein ACM3X4_12580 [Ignavibacteriales bacterium]